MLFARRKQLKILSVLLTGNGTTLACTGYLIFEQDLTSFYETGKLNLPVDSRGDGIHNFCHIALWQKSRRNAFNRTKPDCMMIRKIPVTNPQHQTYTVKTASVCTEKKQKEPLIDGLLEADIKMIVHVADVVENVQ